MPALAKSYQQASEAYEQASIIENQFEKLIQLIIQVECHAIPLEDVSSYFCVFRMVGHEVLGFLN